MLWDAAWDQQNVIQGKVYSDHIADIMSRSGPGEPTGAVPPGGATPGVIPPPTAGETTPPAPPVGSNPPPAPGGGGGASGMCTCFT